jgi:NADPH:quinone reductase-like Zn-dependent oxidoreductase
MEAYHIDRFGSVDGIALRSSEDPRPGPRDILIRVRASSLNYRDLMVLKGGGRGPAKPGVVPLSDGAGDVAAVGDRVTGSRSATASSAPSIRAGSGGRSPRTI